MLPSNCQVKVVDRTAVVTTNAETKAVSPHGIQEAIDAETGKMLEPDFVILAYCF